MSSRRHIDGTASRRIVLMSCRLRHEEHTHHSSGLLVYQLLFSINKAINTTTTQTIVNDNLCIIVYTTQQLQYTRRRPDDTVYMINHKCCAPTTLSPKQEYQYVHRSGDTYHTYVGTTVAGKKNCKQPPTIILWSCLVTARTVLSFRTLCFPPDIGII